MILKSMTDFVLEQDITLVDSKFKIFKYAQFLKQPLKLEMFVTCDDKGNVLKEPGLMPSYELQQYRKAKEKVLFTENHALKYIENIILDRCNTIEDLLKLKMTYFELTTQAEKQFL